MTAAVRKIHPMSSHRKAHRSEHAPIHPKGRKTPPPADYTEDVNEQYLDALEKCLAPEFEGKEFVRVSGPAW
jgi:hypothetical protein